MNILFIILIILLLMLLVKSYHEPFISNLTIIDPYSIYLHRDISKKEDWWNKTHARQLYYYRDYVPTIFQE